MEDDEDIRFIVSLSLGLDRSIDHQVVETPAEALALLENSDWQPDCIVLNAPVPDRDGHAVLARIRRLPDQRTTPVIFLTGAVRQDEIESHMAVGATGVIAKPFDPLTLATRIREMADAALTPP